MGKAAPTQGLVVRCTRRADGRYLIITKNKLSGVSPVEVPEGRVVTIRDGIVEGAQR